MDPVGHTSSLIRPLLRAWSPLHPPIRPAPPQYFTSTPPHPPAVRGDNNPSIALPRVKAASGDARPRPGSLVLPQPHGRTQATLVWCRSWTVVLLCTCRTHRSSSSPARKAASRSSPGDLFGSLAVWTQPRSIRRSC